MLTIRSKPNARGHMLSALVMDLVIDLCAGTRWESNLLDFPMVGQVGLFERSLASLIKIFEES